MYRFRLAKKEDETAITKLYQAHWDEVEPLGLFDKWRKFFAGHTDSTLEMYVCYDDTNNEIIGGFHIHISGDECKVGSGLCHKKHRRMGPAKMSRKMYRDIAVKRGCKYLIRRHPVGAVHINMSKIESDGWEIIQKGDYVTLRGDLTKLNKENAY